MSDKQKNLVVRFITGVLFVAIMVAGMMQPFALIFLFAIITALTTWEFCGLINRQEDPTVPMGLSRHPHEKDESVNGQSEVTVNRLICTVAGTYFFLAVAAVNSGLVISNAVFVPYLLTIIYLFVSELYLKNKNPLHDWAYTMLSQMYIALPFSMINVLAFRNMPDQSVGFYYLLPLSIFIFLWINDTGAYCAGSLFGRHRLFERISPKKSWEGSIGGGVLVLIAAAIIWHIEQQGENLSGLNLIEWLGLGLVVVVFGTWGDLVESLFKRTLGIKDSGNILPGHGGMLDRFDSSLLAIPAAVVYLFTLQMFT